VYEIPITAKWTQASERQRGRAERSFAKLASKRVPLFQGPRFVDDDSTVQMQRPDEVARRVLALYMVTKRAEGFSQLNCLNEIKLLNLDSELSTRERKFLNDKRPSEDDCRELVWRAESIWVLLWALNEVDELGWPGDVCDVKAITSVLNSRGRKPEFVTDARLRDKAEILDAQDLTMRIHWAVRNVQLHGDGLIPINLDWSQSKRLPAFHSPLPGVVYERHYALNWLVNYPSPEDWDSVETPT